MMKKKTVVHTVGSPTRHAGPDIAKHSTELVICIRSLIAKCGNELQEIRRNCQRPTETSKYWE